MMPGTASILARDPAMAGLSAFLKEIGLGVAGNATCDSVRAFIQSILQKRNRHETIEMVQME